MVRWTPPLTLNQQIAIAIIPKITSSFSIAGSIFIVQHVLRSPKRRGLCYHRILLGLSCMDVISSFKSFLATWVLPRETGAWGAFGTVGTCTAAGFFGQGASIASPLYNGSLALFYLLTVRYGWRDDRSGAYGARGGRFSRIEPWMHAVPLLFGWGTAIAGLPLLLYNPIGWTCWIAEVPRGCDRDPSVQCERGDNSYIYRWAFFHAELWFTFVAILIMMLMMYKAVREKERKSQRYSTNSIPNEGTRNKQQSSYSRRVSMQALLYVLAYYITWIFPAITWITQLFGKTYTPILMLQAFFVPLQGFFNAFVYLRPRYMRHRREMPDEPRIRAILSTLSEGRKKERPQEPPSGGVGEVAAGRDRGPLRDSDFHSQNEHRKSFIKRMSQRLSKSNIIINKRNSKRDSENIEENLADEDDIKKAQMDAADEVEKAQMNDIPRGEEEDDYGEDEDMFE